jgi:hypothetical protein
MVGGSVCCLLAMFSWDTMVLTPVAIALLGILVYRRYSTALLLLFIPLYVTMRTAAHAVPLEGNYGVHIDKILVNSVGNSITYVAATLVGPRAIETGAAIRSLTKYYAAQLTIGGLFVLSALLFFAAKWKHRWKTQRMLIGFMAASIIMSIPYLGLGGASDRYTLVPSVFIVIIGGLLFERLLQRFPSTLLLPCLMVLWMAVMAWNYTELTRVTREWKFAGTVTEQALLTIRKRFYPPTEVKTFVFINTPIRYGRAWIFPTGLDDALWHMFRGTPFYVVQVDSADKAFTIEDPIEFVHENKKSMIEQREVGTHTKDFTIALRAALRENPDVILIGEMRDLETIELALTAAETGHLVLGTLHTSGAADAVSRMIDVFPTTKQNQVRTQIAESLKAVMWQTLIKSKDGKGRLPAVEIMYVNTAIANMIRKEKVFQINSAIETGTREGMQSMKKAVMDLLQADLITEEDANANIPKELEI